MFIDLMECSSIAVVSGYGSPPPVVMRFSTGIGPGDWRVDLRTKRLADGQQFSCCTVFELETRFCLAATVVNRFGIAELINTLEEALARHDTPHVIFVGQHTASDLKRLEIWGAGRGVEIRPGTGGGGNAPDPGMRMPTGERWSSLDQAKRTISRWRRDANRQFGSLH